MASSAGTMPNTGRWGWYKDHEGREWRRVSTLIKKVDTNTGALDEWKKRQVLLGAARRDDIVMGVKALGEAPATGNPLPVIVDVKTEGQPLLNGLHIGPQLAIYSRAKRMWIPSSGSANGLINAQYVDAPCVRQDVAVIVHVRDGKAVPYFVDLAAGWEAAQAAARQLKREQAAKKWFAPVPGIIEPKPAEVIVDSAAARKVGHLDAPAVTAAQSLATALVDAFRVTATVLGPAPMPGAEQVATRGADGLVRWGPATEPQAPETRLIDLIRQAPDLTALAELYASWDAHGNVWTGPIAVEGDQRRKIVECAQRALHTAGTCACGWSQGMPA